MRKLHVIGESFIDRYVFMDSDRVEPATKVPVITNKEKIDVAGGAANLVTHMKKLFSLNHYYKIEFYTNNKPPIKERIYIDHKPMYRFDHGDKVKHNRDMISNMIDEIREGDYVIISNYHKGLLSDYDIYDILDVCKLRKVITFVDTNIVSEEYYGCDYLKINEKTLVEYENNFNQDIKKHFGNVVITMGINGYKYYGDNFILQNGDNHNRYDFIDSIGAGDAFFASLIYNIITEENMYDSLIKADKYAAESCTRLGTINIC